MSVAVKGVAKCSFVQVGSSGLWIGDKYSCRDLELLKQLEIRTIINCTVTPKAGGVRNYFSSDFRYLRVPVKDSDLEGKFFAKIFVQSKFSNEFSCTHKGNNIC